MPCEVQKRNFSQMVLPEICTADKNQSNGKNFSSCLSDAGSQADASTHRKAHKFQRAFLKLENQLLTSESERFR